MEDSTTAAATSPSPWNDSTTAGSGIDTAEQDYRSYTIYKIAGLLIYYVPPFVLLPGFFGNIMTIVIMRRMKSGDSTINVYFMALAVFDNMYLFTIVLWDWVRLMFGFSLMATHPVVCKTFTWLYTGSMVVSAWLLVCMTVHRALSVVWPHRVNVLCTQRRVRLLIVGIAVFFAAVHSHNFYGAYTVCSPARGKCWCVLRTDDAIYRYFLVHVFVYIDLVSYCLLPFIFMVAANAVLIWKLNQSVKAAGRVLSQGDPEQVRAREKAARSVTVTVAVVSLTFLVLTLPGSMNYMLTYFSKTEEGTSSYQRAVSIFMGILSNILGFVNTSINFYLYCLTGRRFREEFLKILGCGKNRGRRGARH